MTSLTVDELAARSGASVRTIRYYQSEGLLPAPARAGREARYGEAHLDRLALIGELQSRGLRLSAIGRLLTENPEAAGDWLGLGETMIRPWSEDRPELLDEAELDHRLAGTPPGTRAALEGTDLLERRGDTTPVTYLVPSPGLLEIAVSLARLGLDLAVAAHLRDLLQRRLRAMTNELVAEFTGRISLDRLEEGGPGALAELLVELRPITQRTVDLLFAHEMERAQRELIDAAFASEDR